MKHVGTQAGIGRSGDFRAFTGAVSLKPVLPGIIGRQQRLFPRLHRRGLIEAKLATAHFARVKRDFRAFTGAVSLKRDFGFEIGDDLFISAPSPARSH